MKITVIISAMLIAQVSAAFFDVFQGAVLSVQNSFGKLFSDVVTDVKDTVDCTILAVEHVLSLSQDATARYYEKCGRAPNGTVTEKPKEVILPTVEISISNNEEYLKKVIPEEIDARINATLSRLLSGYNPHDKLEDVEKGLAKETERLANVSELVKQELEKLSNVIHLDLKNLERNDSKPSVDSILEQLKLLEAIEQNIRNTSEAKEIHRLIDDVLHKLNTIEAAGTSENAKVERILKDLEDNSNSSYTDLRQQIKSLKSEEERHIELIKSKLKEHDQSPEHIAFLQNSYLNHTLQLNASVNGIKRSTTETSNLSLHTEQPTTAPKINTTYNQNYVIKSIDIPLNVITTSPKNITVSSITQSLASIETANSITTNSTTLSENPITPPVDNTTVLTSTGHPLIKTNTSTATITKTPDQNSTQGTLTTVATTPSQSLTSVLPGTTESSSMTESLNTKPSPSSTTESPNTKPSPSSTNESPNTKPASSATTESSSTKPAPSAITESPSTKPALSVKTEPPSTKPAPSATTEPPSTKAAPSATTEPPSTKAASSGTTEPPSTKPAPSATTEPPSTKAASSGTTEPPSTKPAPSVTTEPPSTKPAPSATTEPPSTKAASSGTTEPPSTKAAPSVTTEPLSTKAAPSVTTEPLSTKAAPSVTTEPLSTKAAPSVTTEPLSTKAALSVKTEPPSTKPAPSATTESLSSIQTPYSTIESSSTLQTLSSTTESSSTAPNTIETSTIQGNVNMNSTTPTTTTVSLNNIVMSSTTEIDIPTSSDQYNNTTKLVSSPSPVQINVALKSTTPVAITTSSYTNENNHETLISIEPSILTTIPTTTLNPKSTIEVSESEDPNHVDQMTLKTTTLPTTVDEDETSTTTPPVTTAKISKQLSSSRADISDDDINDNDNVKITTPAAITETTQIEETMENKDVGISFTTTKPMHSSTHRPTASTPSLNDFLSYIDRIVSASTTTTQAAPIAVQEPPITMPPVRPYSEPPPYLRSNTPLPAINTGLLPSPRFMPPRNVPPPYAKNIPLQAPANMPIPPGHMAPPPRLMPLAYNKPPPYPVSNPRVSMNRNLPPPPRLMPPQGGYKPNLPSIQPPNNIINSPSNLFNRPSMSMNVRPVGLTTQIPLSTPKTNNFDDPDYNSFFHTPSKDTDAHAHALREARQLIADSKRSHRIMDSILNGKRGRRAFGLPNALKFGK